jgi:acyl transferase domain-containing protein
LEDAARIICRRGSLLRRVSGKGAMVVADLTPEQAGSVIEGLEDRVSIGAINGARSTALSGDPAALEGILELLKRREVFCRWVKIDFASHSPQMDPLLPELLAQLDGLAPRPSTIPIYSTVKGAVVDGSAFNAQYWADNLRKPVLFSTAVELLKQNGHDCFVEVSPHPILLQAIRERCQAAVVTLPSLRRDEDEQAVMYESLGALHVRGCEVDWNGFYPEGGRDVPLGPYPWQRERFWFQERDTRTASKPEQASGIDNLLYRVNWRAEALPIASKPPTAGSWILFADHQGSAKALGARLQASEQTCVLVSSGAAYGELPDGNFQIRPGEEQDFQKVCLLAAAYSICGAWIRPPRKT